MQAVGRDDQIALVRRTTLEPWVSVDVEQCVLQECELSEACARLAEEDLRHIGEDIPLARVLKHG